MKIKDVEERTGLSRSNVRFYEKEKLIEPSRNESNGYRDYSENDVENIKKIAYLLYNPFKAFLCLFFYISQIIIQPSTCKQIQIYTSTIFFVTVKIRSFFFNP